MSASAGSPDVAIGKMVILVGEFVRAGSARQAYLLARTLRQKHGIDTEVWALWNLRNDAGFVRQCEAAGVPARVIAFRHPPAAPTKLFRALRWGAEIMRVVRLLKRAKVDVLLPFSSWPNVVAGLSYRLAGVRLCVWGERHAGGTRVDPKPERLAIGQYRQFIANSTAGIEFLTRKMRIPQERISLIPSCVEEPKLRAIDWRVRLRLNPVEPLVVMVGNFNVGHKDLPTLLRAWAIVQQNWTSGDRPFLALAGSRSYYDASYQEALRIRRKECLDSSVRFLDFTVDVPDLINAADITIYCSKLEGMPDGILECMTAGKAVVATDLPGIRDALGPISDELLAPPGDADRLARVLLDLLHNKPKREALGKANKARARAEFTVDRMAESHLRFIQENLPRASGKSGQQPADLLQNRSGA